MRLLALLLPIALLASPAQGKEEVPRANIITVSGKGEVKVEPDEAFFTFSVEHFDRDLDTARRSNDGSIGKIRMLGQGYGVAAKDIRIDRMEMETLRELPKKDRDTPELRHANPVRGYLVSKRITLRLANLARFADFHAELLKTGISEISSVDFRTSRLLEHREAARMLAMKAAQQKAAALSGALGQQIGRAVDISEGEPASLVFGRSNTFQNSSSVVDDSAGDGFSAGQISVSASVTVVFELR